MTSPSEMARRLAAVVAGIDGSTSPAARVCEASRVVAGADGAAVSLAQLDGGVERVPLSSAGPGAARLEEIQDSLGEGPAFDALLDDVAVDASPPEMAARWPLFAGLASRDVPLARISAFPMHTGTETTGVLLLFLSGPGAFAYDRMDLALLADAAAASLGARSPVDELVTDSAWAGRSTVNRATGMVMAQLTITAADALALLRAHAYAVDATLPEVAAQVLERTLVFQPPETL